MSNRQNENEHIVKDMAFVIMAYNEVNGHIACYKFILPNVFYIRGIDTC